MKKEKERVYNVKLTEGEMALISFCLGKSAYNHSHKIVNKFEKALGLTS